VKGIKKDENKNRIWNDEIVVYEGCKEEAMKDYPYESFVKPGEK